MVDYGAHAEIAIEIIKELFTEMNSQYKKSVVFLYSSQLLSYFFTNRGCKENIMPSS